MSGYSWVFPEGARGTAKLAKGRTHAGALWDRLCTPGAKDTQPNRAVCVFLGGGEAVPTIANLSRLGKLIGVPYLPVTPYIFPIPAPRDVPADLWRPDRARRRWERRR